MEEFGFEYEQVVTGMGTVSAESAEDAEAQVAGFLVGRVAMNPDDDAECGIESGPSETIGFPKVTVRRL